LEGKVKNKIRGRVLESARTRARTMASVTESGNQRKKREKRKKNTVGTSERKVGRGCLTSTQKNRKGGNGPRWPGLHEARRGRVYMEMVRIEQVRYEQRV
jgi:hypothetical protein